MKLYNGTNAQITLELIKGNPETKMSIEPHSVTPVDFLANNDFLSMIANCYDEKEIALIVGGAAEMSQCANIPAVMGLVVQSVDEAIKRFAKK